MRADSLGRGRRPSVSTTPCVTPSATTRTPSSSPSRGSSASTTLRTKRGWCVTKAVLLAACCRAVGIPARLGFADVRNHLTTTRMREQMKTDVFFWHGYTSIYLDGSLGQGHARIQHRALREVPARGPWTSTAGPTRSITPSISTGNRHMEYLNHRGEYADVPIERDDGHVPPGIPRGPSWNQADFDREVEQENPGE
ncbi:MAG: transglutaminase family protein [Desulfobacterales bacterium]|nr:transglutaminase family protein [Desulfobacterales bacterium]